MLEYWAGPESNVIDKIGARDDVSLIQHKPLDSRNKKQSVHC